MRLDDVETFRNALYQEWKALGVLGRIYLSQEGINAQVVYQRTNSVPSASARCRSEFNDVPFKIAVEDDGKSFLKLMIKVRPKLVADGLTDDAFDTTNVGEHLDAATFNQKIDEGALVSTCATTTNA